MRTATQTAARSTLRPYVRPTETVTYTVFNPATARNESITYTVREDTFDPYAD